MYLAKIRVQNFRNFRDVTVRLSPGLNVIVGENNIGKSNLLDAIRVALGPASLADQAPRLSKDDLHVLANGDTVTGPIRIDLVFENLSIEEQAEFLDCLEYDAADPSRSRASIHYEWSWSEARKRWHHRRWGGSQTNTEAAVPEDNLQSIKVILLDALRDAVRALAPGRESRLGKLLDTIATDDDRSRIEEVFAEANRALEADEDLIKVIERRIGAALEEASKGLSQTAFIRASETRFERVVAGLRLLVQMGGPAAAPVLRELRWNGLGYNNLLFIGTVLAELGAAKDAALPVLLVEEPEAHLHPQLQTLLADFLGNGAALHGAADVQKVQTVLTTHSPTIAAHVPPQVIRVLHRDSASGPCCVGIGECGLDEIELRRLRRMLDVTRASLLFSRGVVLVEGISEQILLPVLARRIGVDLAAHGVSVVSIAGVSFKTIAKLFGPEQIRLRVSLVTDSDPAVVYPDGDENWQRATPQRDAAGGFVRGARLEKLLGEFSENDVVRVFASDVTLEYDLALAGADNPARIYETWAGLYDHGPRSLTKTGFLAADDKAVALWRAICVASPQHGKGELAQALAEVLERPPEAGAPSPDFVVPPYIRKAIEHVVPPPGAAGTDAGAG